MKGRTAGLAMISFCLVVAVLLLTGTISSRTSYLLFALALVAFGLLSRGFLRR